MNPLSRYCFACAIPAFLLLACSPSEEAAKPTACRVLSPSTVLAKDPGMLSLSIGGVDSGAATIYVADTVERTKHPLQITNGRGEIKLRSMALGPFVVRLEMNETTLTCSGNMFTAPGYPVAQTFSEIKGSEVRAVAADLNGDQHLDVLTSTGAVLYGDGLGGFRAERFSDETTDRIGTADFNGDGRLDIVGWNRRGSRSISDGYVLLSQNETRAKSTTFRNAFLTGSYGEAAFADFDGDGYADTVTVSQNGLWVRWNEAGTLAAPIRFDATLGAEARGFGVAESENDYLSTIQVADVNADQQLDIIYGRMSIAQKNGARTFHVTSNLFSFATNCSGSLGTSCPRIVGFFVMDFDTIFAPFLSIANQYFKGVNPMKADWATDGTWFGYGDFDGDKKPDVIGFGLLNTPNGAGILTGSGSLTSVNPFFAEKSPGNVSAIFIDKFDERQADNQALLVSGHGQIYLYRQRLADK